MGGRGRAGVWTGGWAGPKHTRPHKHTLTARKAASVRPSWYLGPRSMPSVRLMARGTVASTSASTDSNPHRRAIADCSAGEMELWRGANLQRGWAGAGVGGRG